MEDKLKKSVLKASHAEALKLANQLKEIKVFSVKIEENSIIIKAPLKDENGNWILNEEGKIKRFLVFEYTRNPENPKLESMRYNPEIILIE